MLAGRTNCKCSIKTSRNWVIKEIKLGNMVHFGKNVQFSNKATNECNVMKGVTAYGHVQDCHVSFWRGGPHIV